MPVEPHRGNILNDRGELMVSTLPLYKIYLDFVYQNKDSQKDTEETRHKRDSLWRTELKALSKGLNEIFPEKSAEKFEQDLWYGFRNKKRYYWLYNRKISYTQYQRLLKLPIIKLGKKYSGIIVEEEIQRKNIFGDIGMSTFGIVRRTTDKKGVEIEEINGLEKKYDKYLRGVAGVGRKEKTGGKFILKIDRPAENGMDVQTTINSEMLDICENAVKKVLKRHHLPAGWAILMETATGDIKAVVNLTKLSNGTYAETIENIPNNPTPNHAFCRLMEPGSIFKTVALTAAIEDGRLTVRDSVKSYSSKVCTFNGKTVTDEMYRDNGTGRYSMAEALKYSSNISMVQYIRKAYSRNPSDYTNTLIRFGLTENYNLIESEATPYLTLPGTKRWNGLSLNSMSYGYAVGMTGINMISFYNTIANGGRQMQPRLVKAILKDGQVVEEFPTKVLNEQLISKSTADAVTGLLIEVVNGKDGTGKRAKSSSMLVAGKTGTARMVLDQSERKGSRDPYRDIDGRRKYQATFVGFFPAEDPQYTAIVTVYTKPTTKSVYGGVIPAMTFRELVDQVWSLDSRWGEQYGKKADVPAMKPEYIATVSGTVIPVPDVKGMGLKDAIYAIENNGYRCRHNGTGHVTSQQPAQGTILKKGETITITLQ